MTMTGTAIHRKEARITLDYGSHSVDTPRSEIIGMTIAEAIMGLCDPECPFRLHSRLMADALRYRSYTMTNGYEGPETIVNDTHHIRIYCYDRAEFT